MAFAGVNYLAIALAAAAAFVFGGVWYGILSKPWMAAVGKTEQDIKASGTPMAVLFVVTFIAQLVMAWALAGIIGHLGVGQVTLRNGLITGALAWLGFVATTLVVNHGFQGAKPALTVIDGGHWLGVLLIQGAIIGWMGVR
jgi:Protein of unknown function (DUF1761)